MSGQIKGKRGRTFEICPPLITKRAPWLDSKLQWASIGRVNATLAPLLYLHLAVISNIKASPSNFNSHPPPYPFWDTFNSALPFPSFSFPTERFRSFGDICSGVEQTRTRKGWEGRELRDLHVLRGMLLKRRSKGLWEEDGNGLFDNLEGWMLRE